MVKYFIYSQKFKYNVFDGITLFDGDYIAMFDTPNGADNFISNYDIDCYFLKDEIMKYSFNVDGVCLQSERHVIDAYGDHVEVVIKDEVFFVDRGDYN